MKDFSLHHIASLISIFLTIPTLTTALAVMIRWWPRVKTLLFRKNKNMHAEDWFIRGVFKSFVKDFFDNGYWLIPWSLVFIGSSHAELWIMAGVYVNCLVRQGIGLLAARCYLKASELYRSTHEMNDYKVTFKLSFLTGCVLGLFYIILLTI